MDTARPLSRLITESSGTLYCASEAGNGSRDAPGGFSTRGGRQARTVPDSLKSARFGCTLPSHRFMAYVRVHV